jgi:hypothetical protein
MGRFRIKKKESVIPFRQTLAYRILMLALSIIAFLYLIYEMVVAWALNNTVAFIIAFIPAVAAAFTIFFNADHLRYARMPARTLKRLNRR